MNRAPCIDKNLAQLDARRPHRFEYGVKFAFYEKAPVLPSSPPELHFPSMTIY